jgi:hypothetical protein
MQGTHFVSCIRDLTGYEESNITISLQFCVELKNLAEQLFKSPSLTAPMSSKFNQARASPGPRQCVYNASSHREHRLQPLINRVHKDCRCNFNLRSSPWRLQTHPAYQFLVFALHNDLRDVQRAFSLMLARRSREKVRIDGGTLRETLRVSLGSSRNPECIHVGQALYSFA